MSDVVARVRTASISQGEADFTRSPADAVEGKFFFGTLVCFLWPKPKFKPEHELHIRTGATSRMCRWWIDGTHPPSAAAVRALFGEILWRLGWWDRKRR